MKLNEDNKHSISIFIGHRHFLASLDEALRLCFILNVLVATLGQRSYIFLVFSNARDFGIFLSKEGLHRSPSFSMEKTDLEDHNVLRETIGLMKMATRLHPEYQKAITGWVQALHPPALGFASPFKKIRCFDWDRTVGEWGNHR